MSASEMTTSTITTTTMTTVYTTKTNFENVCDFNEQFGVKKLDTPCLDDEYFIESKMALIREEMSELEEAVKNKDLVETVDALTDILYVVLGMGYGINVNLDQAFKIVHESNMSKMCLTEEEAKETVAWYKIHQVRYTTPTYRVNSAGNYVVYDEKTRKILKSIYYKPADLNYVF